MAVLQYAVQETIWQPVAGKDTQAAGNIERVQSAGPHYNEANFFVRPFLTIFISFIVGEGSAATTPYLSALSSHRYSGDRALDCVPLLWNSNQSRALPMWRKWKTAFLDWRRSWRWFDAQE
jgi:hypothetical protein